MAGWGQDSVSGHGQGSSFGIPVKHRALEAKVLDSPRIWWTVWTGAAVLCALYGLLSLAIVVAPWGYGPWMLGVGAAIIPVVLLLGAAARLTMGRWLRLRQPRAEAEALFGLHGRSTLFFITMAICIVSYLFPLLMVRQAVTARSLGYHVLTAPTVAVFEKPGCRKSCQQLVIFRTEAQEYVQTPLAIGGIFPDIRPGTTLVYDPLHPDRVMTQPDWRAGLQSGGLVGAALIPIIPVGWAGFLIANMRRRERAFGGLRPNVAITSVRKYTRTRELWWRVTFADGKHVGYNDTPAMRAALEFRVDMNNPAAHLADVGHGLTPRTRQRTVLETAGNVLFFGVLLAIAWWYR